MFAHCDMVPLFALHVAGGVRLKHFRVVPYSPGRDVTMRLLTA